MLCEIKNHIHILGIPKEDKSLQLTNFQSE